MSANKNSSIISKTKDVQVAVETKEKEENKKGSAQ